MTTRIISLDSEGRLEIPAHSRTQLGIGPGDLVEFLVSEDGLILRKLQANSGEAAAVAARSGHRAAPAGASGSGRNDSASAQE